MLTLSFVTRSLLLACFVQAPDRLLAQAPTPVFFEYQLRHAKEQQLQWDKLPKRLRLFGEIRGRTEGQTSYDLKKYNDRTYELSRLRGGFEVDVAPMVKVTVAVQDTHALALPIPSVASTMRDQFDLFTGTVDFHWKNSFHFVAGRQPLTFGSEHLVGISDWANNSRSWDGFSARIGSRTSLDLFSTSVVSQRPTSLDTHGGGLTFHGAVVTIPFAAPHLKVQPFVYVLALPHVSSPVALPGAELETTFGAEVSGTETNGLQFDVLGALQRGSRATSNVSAGAAAARVGWFFRDLGWTPRLVGEFDYASGDGRSAKDHNGTFDQVYASNHGKFGLVDQFGLQNLIQVQGNLDVSPVHDATIRIEGERLQLANRLDNVYKSDGTVLSKAPLDGFRTPHLGLGIDVSSTYVYREYLLFEAGAGHLFPGGVLSQSAQRPSLTVGYLQITYKFRSAK